MLNIQINAHFGRCMQKSCLFLHLSLEDTSIIRDPVCSVASSRGVESSRQGGINDASSRYDVVCFT
jgi:hypothetical protein